MSEAVFKTSDSITYKANNVSSLDKRIVQAFIANDTNKIEEIINSGLPLTIDVFISIDRHPKACILIVPAGNETLHYIQPMRENPINVPDIALCWRIDLYYDEVQLETYQISIKYDLFKEFKKTIREAFFIGRYENVRHVLCLHLVILRASPNHFNASFEDCIAFAKEFCVYLLGYCSNAEKMEEIVNNNIKKLAAAEDKVENLPRNFELFGLLGNLLVGRSDVCSFVTGKHVVMMTVVMFILIYPFIVSLMVFYIYANIISKYY